MIIYCPLKFMDYNVDTRLLQELNQLKLLKIKIINPGSLLITLIN